MASRAARLVTLIMLLQRRPNQRAGELAAALGVSVRSLHRYIVELDEMGIPIYSERGPHGGFSLVRGYKMPPLVFTPEEAVAVYLGTSLVGEMWGRPYAEAAAGALAKLDNLLPEEQRHEVAWARRSLVALGLHQGDLAALAPTLETLRRAVHERCRVRLLYGDSTVQWQRGARSTSTRWCTAGAGGMGSAIATCARRCACFGWIASSRWSCSAQLSRCHRASTSGPTWRNRRRHSPRCVPGCVLRLSGRTWRSTIEPCGKRWRSSPTGRSCVTLLSPDMAWAAATAFGFGPTTIVEEPSELREMMRTWAQALVSMYEPG